MGFLKFEFFIHSLPSILTIQAQIVFQFSICYRYAVAGLRTRLSNHKNDLENYMTEEGKKLVKLIWKRYFKSVENSYFVDDEVIISRIKTSIDNGKLQVEIYDEAFERAENILKSLVISFVKIQNHSNALWNWYNTDFNPGRSGIYLNSSTELLPATLLNLPNDCKFE